MPRLNLQAVAVPFLYALPRTGKTLDVALSLRSTPNGGALAWLTARGYCPDDPHDYLRAAPRTPRLRRAVQNAVAWYRFPASGLPQGAPHAFENDEAPAFTPPPCFAHDAFSACFRLPGKPDYLEAEWRRMAAAFLPDTPFTLYLDTEAGAPAALPADADPEPLEAFLQETPHGNVRVLLERDRQAAMNLNAGGLAAIIRLPTIPAVSAARAFEPPLRARLQAPFESPLARYYWTEHTTGNSREAEFERDLRDPVLTAMANYLQDHPEAPLTHAGWTLLNEQTTGGMPLPKPFFCPWQPAQASDRGPDWKAPRPLDPGSAYRVALDDPADQHLLALAWPTSMAHAQLVYSHPDTQDYPFTRDLPVIDEVTFTLPQDPARPLTTQAASADDHFTLRDHPELWIRVRVTRPGQDPAWLNLEAPCAFQGLPGPYPCLDVHVSRNQPPDPETLLNALVQAFFEAREDADSPDPQAQRQHFHLETLTQVFTHLKGADPAQQRLMQCLFDTYVFPYTDRRPAIIHADHPQVTVYYPPALN